MSDKSCIYAALILADDNVPITADKLQAITTAAGAKVQPFWFNLIAKAFEGKDVKELLSNVGSAAPASGGPAAAAAAGGDAPAAESKKEAAKEESSDDDMGFGLFD
mmetsp:Transcript_79443/g.246416  ORF Transcript_79443/g.246416 Transcript_79443/m.246416 type:complete len:106 (+) Transcript_79443:94-411(+)|eukprot:CAMPEP_0204580292 /NCGR_PEP_ID=MMETSP0661-20131031/43983_1 /ASSEMBLY_ACC=CAM_ASM_000606 /TAXON_ID=109239 /ORGANISM="Alexandrium margalefi, Strain AMGDE01CS-322" /LENGTH=105 /DNA_ID=CAMNT_0051589369 /DNA_START=94 /DNA_END=411 /DNA_ORIENTATION=+